MDELYNRAPRISLAQAFHSPLPAMHGTVVHDPEDTTSIVVGWSSHHLLDQTVKRRDTVYRFAPAEHSGVVGI
jgi:hypothetical protein